MDTTTTPCDIRTPIQESESARLDRQFRESEEAWDRHARYEVFISRFQVMAPRAIARWLTYKEACDLRERLQKAHFLRHPEEVGRMVATSFSIQRLLPKLNKRGPAEVGDLIIHETMAVPRINSSMQSGLFGDSVVRVFMKVGRVTRTLASGVIDAFQDRDGEHRFFGKNFWVVSQAQVDCRSIMDDLDRRYEERGHWGIEFVRLDEVSHFLAVRHHVQPATLDLGDLLDQA